MLRAITRSAAPAARGVTAQIARRSATRGMAESAEGRVVPTAEELARTREFLNLVDDRLAAKLAELTGGIARVEARVGRLEDRLDKFATKEHVKEGFEHMETRLKYYLLAGAGGLVITGITMASRSDITFFGSPKKARDVEIPEAHHAHEPKAPASVAQ